MTHRVITGSCFMHERASSHKKMLTHPFLVSAFDYMSNDAGVRAVA